MLRCLSVTAAALVAATAVVASDDALAASPELPDRGLPVVLKVAPAEVQVGQELFLRGRNFLPGRMRNQVVFARPGIRPVFALADRATRTTIRVRVPAKLLADLRREGGRPVPTRFQVTVLTDRFQPRFTRTPVSPLISAPPATAGVPGALDCDGDGIAETARRGIFGLLVVGLRLVGYDVRGFKLPDVAGVRGVTDDRVAPAVHGPAIPRIRGLRHVLGLPGVPNLALPEEHLPQRSMPEQPPVPDCAPPAPSGS